MAGELAAAQHGVVARRQLLDLGLTAREITRRIEFGRLHPVHRGVYAVGHPVLSLNGRWLAAVLASGPKAVLSHRSAAHLWGLRATDRTRVEVTVPQWIRPRQGIEVHVTALAADEITTRHGIPTTTPQRTLADLAKVVPPRAVERAREQAVILRLVDDHAPNPTRSELEEAFLALVRENGLPEPERNAKVWTEDGWLEVDALWRSRRLVVELDGYATHGNRAAFERDRARDRALTVAGHRVVRLTWRDAHDDRTATQVRRLLDVH